MVAVSGNAAGCRRRGKRTMDYTAVTTLKMTALRMAWKQFSRREDEQMTAFREFVLREGESLYWQAAFDALHAWQVQQDPLRWGWLAGRRPFRISTARGESLLRRA